MAIRLLVLLLLSLGYVTTSKAEDTSIDHSTAIEQLILDANTGDAEAQYQLGLIYMQGIFVKADIVTSATWFARASDQFHVDAMRQYRDMLFRGEGVEQDLDEAVAIGHSLAVFHDPRDVYAFAVMIYENNNDFYGHRRTAEWLEISVGAGHIPSIVKLGQMNLAGEGMDQNYEAAFDLFYQAAKQNDPEGNRMLAHMFSEGLGLQMDEELALALEILAENPDNKWSLQKLGGFFEKNPRVAQGIHDALFWHTKAANLGHLYSQTQIGIILSTPRHRIVDYAAASEWLLYAAGQGDTRAQEALANLHDRGILPIE